MVFADNATHKQIANYFETKHIATVRWWIKSLFDRIPDSRLERRQRRIDAIVDFKKTHSEKESKKVFKRNNKEYYREAVFLAYQQGIYVNEGSIVQEQNSLQSTVFPQ